MPALAPILGGIVNTSRDALSGAVNMFPAWRSPATAGLSPEMAAIVERQQEMDGKWAEFKMRHRKVYANAEEEAMRKAIFQRNIIHREGLDARNGNHLAGTHMSPLADWSIEEFNARNNMGPHYKKRHGGWANWRNGFVGGKPALEPMPLVDGVGADSFDWVDQGAVTGVKDQGQCGSCWAFSTVANAEGVNYVNNYELKSLAEEELVDCDDNGDQGCQGGLPENADNWLANNNIGLEKEGAYPYHAGTDQHGGSCNLHPSQYAVYVGGVKSISQDEDQIAKQLSQYGPLSMGLNAGPMQMYFGGIDNPEDCDPYQIDHAVTLVGYGCDEDVPMNKESYKAAHQEYMRQKAMGNYRARMPLLSEHGGRVGKEGCTPYWKIKNSWASSWGEDGYYRLIRGQGACGMNQMITTATGVQTGKQNPRPILALEDKKADKDKKEM